MRAVTATAVVGSDHTMTLPVPVDVPIGPQKVVVVLQDTAALRATEPLNFAPHPVGPADPTCTYRREDLYGDDGR